MKKILIAIAVLIVLLVVAVIAIPFLIPVDSYKSKLIAAVKDSTGRDLRIDGKMSFSLFPVVGLEANDVSFSNPPGAASKDMAKLGKLQVALQVLPLLHRDIEIKSLVLIDPVIDLEVDKQGQPNWQFSDAKTAPAAKQPDKAACERWRQPLWAGCGSTMCASSTATSPISISAAARSRS